ncbi:ribosomal protein S16 [Chlamydia pneumoniae TW-183]|uniref:Small ribosomal subunit protein bS16 n=2 Tax=Chlamydia pneumoniae TaxID=83558 RepID=RS16_CHLPN|nr:30S ribosomal protein S16 [Chlamydia pneumoniae]Q9Z965.1 RecName: Full=Small ribosomal subunit protein bS16; AltName: Full=30S ribosomal protein S16 [Chlamydia pneumoniae]AAD18269.1 S16 Ribosomal Protein [Chlamydia pneumoniae CWL029]AAF73692.1 ribosomal protein S16 [Chlamydia pneumoniae AR39]AAP98050.1 ribosomal protein S16 [Chlamydia pneumoniae TW-183]ACZ33097.1 ribosomal protein S16 [Chlamydia pneumoniae LPCoLN]ETR80001.1 SSU ribosomal protein S16p [Chlamydia pneumoniae B21]
MALKIRLRQQGRRNHVVYRLVLADVESPRDGKYIELLGWYDPHSSINYQLKSERIFYWLERGAQLSSKAEALVKQGAPGVYSALLSKQEARKLVVRKKRRAYRQRRSTQREEAAKDATK